MRALPKLLAASAAVVLGLTACGSTGGGSTSATTPATGSTATTGAHKPVNDAADLKALDTISVSDTAAGKEPTVTFATKPVKVGQTAVKVITPGTGDESTAASRVTVRQALYQGSSGSKLDSNYAAASPSSFLLSSGDTIPGLNIALTGVKAGSRILFAIPPADAFGSQGNTAAGIGAEDSLADVADIISVGTPLTEATGAAVAPKAGLPTVTFDKTKGPTITVDKATAAPTSLVSQLLVSGTGAEVKTGQSVTVHYTGVVYSTGAVFDSSWTKGTPFTFDIGTSAVIPGWDKGLVGKKVGSRVLLVIPPADGYGAKAQGSIPANSTLVFVVDIRAAG